VARTELDGAESGGTGCRGGNAPARQQAPGYEVHGAGGRRW